jgi:hypothetical protein
VELLGIGVRQVDGERPSAAFVVELRKAVCPAGTLRKVRGRFCGNRYCRRAGRPASPADLEIRVTPGGFIEFAVRNAGFPAGG